jgi:hypothetical protein
MEPCPQRRKILLRSIEQHYPGADTRRNKEKLPTHVLARNNFESRKKGRRVEAYERVAHRVETGIARLAGRNTSANTQRDDARELIEEPANGLSMAIRFELENQSRLGATSRTDEFGSGGRI